MDRKIYEGYKRNSSSENTSSKSVEDLTLTETKTVSQTRTKKNSSKTPTAKSVRKANPAKPRIAMFIDVDNVGISRENLLEILFYANGKYQIEQCKLYGFNDETMPGIKDIAAEYNVTTIGRMKFKESGVNCLDSRLLVDAYECALNNRQKIDMIFIWCYPCDLAELFEKIMNLGINTATIDNSIFDCKNKFVSQTFKLYSPYNFSLQQATYGKVQNQASTTTTDTISNQTSPATSNVSTPSASQTQPLSSDTGRPKLPELDDNFVPPVLPRRTIIERSNPNQKKVEQPEVTDNQENDITLENEETNENNGQPSSLVEEIARKLNLQMPTNEEPSYAEQELKQETDSSSQLLADLLKQAGFSDLLDGEKDVKYEDTIGDL